MLQDGKERLKKKRKEKTTCCRYCWGTGCDVLVTDVAAAAPP